jgi:hypothetical protein
VDGDELEFVLKKNGILYIEDGAVKILDISFIRYEGQDEISVILKIDLHDADIIIPGDTEVAKEYVKENQKQEAAAQAMLTLGRKIKLMDRFN